MAVATYPVLRVVLVTDMDSPWYGLWLVRCSALLTGGLGVYITHEDAVVAAREHGDTEHASGFLLWAGYAPERCFPAVAAEDIDD